jgi:hypothetical protein
VAWFKVDDGLHSSRKLLSIPKRARFAAIGLWTVAGSWCADEVTDGHVPDYMLREWGAPASAPAALVEAGLWDREGDGYVFRNWLEYQPSKQDVEAERAASRERMRELRAKRKQKKPHDSGPKQEVFGRTGANRSESVRNPDPTRPDPISGTHLSTHVTSAPSEHESEPWEPSGAVTLATRQPSAVGRLGEPQKAALRIVSAWEQTFINRPPQKHINDVTAEIQKLVNEGIPPDQISAGLHAWSDGDSYSAKNIPTHVARAGRPKAATGTTRAMQTLDLARQLEQEES